MQVPVWVHVWSAMWAGDHGVHGGALRGGLRARVGWSLGGIGGWAFGLDVVQRVRDVVAEAWDVGGAVSLVHYFEEFDHIEVSDSRVKRGVEVRVLCGASEGEADNRRRCVTCPDCRRLLVDGA